MELATSSARARRAEAARGSVGSRLPVSLAGAPAELRESLQVELATEPLAAAFFVLADGAPTRRPLVRVQRAHDIDADVVLVADVGSSESARQAVFQLVQVLVAQSQRVRVCFLAQETRSAKVRW